MIAGTGATFESSPAATSAPCRSASDTGQLAVRMVKQALSANDSITIAAHSLPYKPTTLVLVADSVTCAAVVASYNGSLDAEYSALQVTSGYVVSVSNGAAYGLLILGSYSGPHYRDKVSIFGPTFVLKWTQQALH